VGSSVGSSLGSSVQECARSQSAEIFFFLKKNKKRKNFIQTTTKTNKNKNKNFYTNNKKQTKRTSVFTPPNLNDTLFQMWQEI
jgi:hypothetical protein